MALSVGTRSPSSRVALPRQVCAKPAAATAHEAWQARRQLVKAIRGEAKSVASCCLERKLRTGSARPHCSTAPKPPRATPHAWLCRSEVWRVALQGVASHGLACSRRSRALYDLRNALSSVHELDELVTGPMVGSRAAGSTTRLRLLPYYFTL